MKKTIIIMLALFLALPALSYAGSATSRWDMTIGGYVKFDMGWANQAQNQDIVLAARGSGVSDNLADKYGSFYTYAGETRLNFLVRGPDAWGAKTSAFVEGHFRGNEANGSASSNAGTFVLRHAFMQFDWPSSKLVIGQTWQTWGILPTFANTMLDYNNLGPFLKGMRQPLVRFEQTIAKNWIWKLGLISPTNTLGSGSVTNTGSNVSQGVDGYTMSNMPFWEGSFGWTSDKCGNIGPWQMLFALEGFYGRQKNVASVAIGNGITTLQDKDVNSYGISFKGFIPIIPEKKGNKAGAFSLSGMLFYTQNPGMFQTPANAPTFNANFAYNTVNSQTTNQVGLTPAQAAAIDYSTPTQYGGWGQLSYFFTDKLFINGWYGYTRSNVSQAWMNAAANTGAMVNTTQIIGNIMYDVNAAIRFGFEYTYYNTRYAGYTGFATGPFAGQPLLQKDGTAQSFRVGAYYFF
ncbi:MAG TPA: hypothetical protein VGJ94_04490 [Syntrophorhabdaceae bacterium]